MRNACALLRRRDGLTMIELLIVVTIMGVLLAIASATYDTVKARVRFGQIKGDMDGIAQAAYNDYTTNSAWAALAFNSMPTNWQRNGELRRWPSPPCTGWYYSWEDWTPFGFPVVQVTLRRGNNTILWGYCVDTSGGGSNCQIADPLFGSVATDLSRVTAHYIYCNE